MSTGTGNPTFPPPPEGPRDPMRGLKANLLEKRKLFDALSQKLIAVGNQLGSKPPESAAAVSQLAAIAEILEALRAYRGELASLSIRIGLDMKWVPEGEKPKWQSLLGALTQADKAALDWSQDSDVIRIYIGELTEGINVDQLVDRAVRNVGEEALRVSSLIGELLG